MEREDQLFLLVRDKDVETLRSWLSDEGRGVDMNPRNDQGQTPLYWACESDDPYLAQLLIDNGADVNICESFGFTPLHLAAYLGHVNLTRVLLNARAAVNATNNEGATPLHLAAKQNHAEIVKLIVGLGANADVLAKDATGATPIQCCEKGNESFEILRARLLDLKKERDANGPVSAQRNQQQAPPVPTSNNNNGNNNNNGGNSVSDSQLQSQMEKMTKAIALLTSNIDMERARVADLEAKLAEEKVRSNELLKKGGLSLCLNCQKKLRECVLLPCMHFYYCGECAKSMSQCTACMTQICGKVPAKLE